MPPCSVPLPDPPLGIVFDRDVVGPVFGSSGVFGWPVVSLEVVGWPVVAVEVVVGPRVGWLVIGVPVHVTPSADMFIPLGQRHVCDLGTIASKHRWLQPPLFLSQELVPGGEVEGLIRGF